MRRERRASDWPAIRPFQFVILLRKIVFDFHVNQVTSRGHFLRSPISLYRICSNSPSFNFHRRFRVRPESSATATAETHDSSASPRSYSNSMSMEVLRSRWELHVSSHMEDPPGPPAQPTYVSNAKQKIWTYRSVYKYTALQLNIYNALPWISEMLLSLVQQKLTQCDAWWIIMQIL